MPTLFTQGDLFAAKGVRAFAQGCNCAGAMGKGIAVGFKLRYPKMFAEYRQKCREGTFLLGDVMVWSDGREIVFNLGTQAHWRTAAELPALTKAVRTMVSLATEARLDRVALPRIGAGLGGLDWADVRHVLQEAGAASPVELVVFETYVPAKTTRAPKRVPSI